MNRPLYTRFPALQARLEHIRLAELPTPVTRENALADRLGLTELWIKRDDISAPDYGGNKIRKLEFLLAEARARQCKTVLTYGGMGSNHALATAVNCRRLGLECIAILTPEPVTAVVRRTMQYHQLLNTRLELANYGAEIVAVKNRLVAETGAANLYEIPFGGSSWLGAIGFVNAAFELVEQIDSGALAQPDIIYLTCGTAGSLAGLALGLHLADRNISIEAVQVTPESLNLQAVFEKLFIETNTELRQRDPLVPLCALPVHGINLRRDQLGEGYAIPTAAALDAAGLMAAYADTESSLTYTAKAMAGLIADASRGLLAGKRVLFWNTYNSRPYPEFAAELDVSALPHDFQGYFRTR